MRLSHCLLLLTTLTNDATSFLNPQIPVSTSSRCHSFARPPAPSLHSQTTATTAPHHHHPKVNNTRRYSKKHKKLETHLLDDFKLAGGEVIQPYRTLKVSRSAERKEIRAAYHKLSRKYHPDGFRHRKIMPGNCNNLEDVRDEWERIKLSYEILSDKQMRARYERHTNVLDPGSAIGRAAMSTIGWGISGLGKGIFKASEMAVSAISETVKENNNKNNNDDEVDQQAQQKQQQQP